MLLVSVSSVWCTTSLWEEDQTCDYQIFLFRGVELSCGSFTDLSERCSSHSRRRGRGGSPAHSAASGLSERLGHTDADTSTDTENTARHSVLNYRRKTLQTSGAEFSREMWWNMCLYGWSGPETFSSSSETTTQAPSDLSNSAFLTVWCADHLLVSGPELKLVQFPQTLLEPRTVWLLTPSLSSDVGPTKKAAQILNYSSSFNVSQSPVSKSCFHVSRCSLILDPTFWPTVNLTLTLHSDRRRPESSLLVRGPLWNQPDCFIYLETSVRI